MAINTKLNPHIPARPRPPSNDYNHKRGKILPAAPNGVSWGTKGGMGQGLDPRLGQDVLDECVGSGD